MKKLFFAAFSLLALVACNQNKHIEAEETDTGTTEEVTFEVARNYFFKSGHEIPASPKIATAEEFGDLFGMATTMGKDGKPTDIDFNTQFVLAVILPVTDMATGIVPEKVESRNDTLFYTYDVTVGEKQSYTIQPLSIIILDKRYENCEVVMIEE